MMMVDREFKVIVIYRRLGVTFYVLEDKVCGFDINQPVPDEIEIIVHDDGSHTELFDRLTERFAFFVDELSLC